MKKDRKAYLLVLLAAFLWGCIGLPLRLMSGAGLTSMQASAFRIFSAAVFYTLYLLIKSPQLLKIKLKHIPLFIVTGVISLGMFNYCYFTAIELSGMSVAAVLLYTAPIFVMLMSAFVFKEKLTTKKIAALIITFIGCIFVTGILGGENTGEISSEAIIFGILSGLGYGLYTVSGKFALKFYPSETVTCWTFIVGSVFLIPISGIFGNLSSALSLPALSGGLIMGIFCCILPYMTYNKALETIEAGRASIISTLEPVVAAMIGIIIFREEVSVMKIFGILLVLTAIVILNIKDRKRKKA